VWCCAGPAEDLVGSFRREYGKTGPALFYTKVLHTVTHIRSILPPNSGPCVHRYIIQSILSPLPFLVSVQWVPRPERMQRQQVKEAIGRSLDRMDTTRLDLLQFHW
jgi:aryl-alcohol dehydrogenase-like predicted oxidoreductase